MQATTMLATYCSARCQIKIDRASAVDAMNSACEIFDYYDRDKSQSKDLPELLHDKTTDQRGGIQRTVSGVSCLV